MKTTNHARKLSRLITLLLAGLTLSSHAWAVGYTITDLGTLGGSYSQAIGLNNNGQVVGYASTTSGASRPFLWSNGSMTELAISPYRIGGINDAGQIVGSFWTSGGNLHAFVTGHNGVGVTDLGTLGGSGSEAYAINSAGQVAGYSYTTSNVAHAFITDSNGLGMRDLGALVTHSLAGGINDAGQVVGWGDGHAFITGPNGVGMTDLGTLGGNSWGQSINNAGQVAGFSDTGTNTFGLPDYHAFLTGPNGVGMTDLGTLGGPRSSAVSINKTGQVVGWSQIAGDSPTNGGEPFITGVNGSDMTPLNSLLPADSVWVLSQVSFINDNGQIVGYGTINGQQHAYLMAPAIVPVPAAAWLLGSGLIGLIGVARRKAA